MRHNQDNVIKLVSKFIFTVVPLDKHQECHEYHYVPFTVTGMFWVFDRLDHFDLELQAKERAGLLP